MIMLILSYNAIANVSNVFCPASESEETFFEMISCHILKHAVICINCFWGSSKIEIYF